MHIRFLCVCVIDLKIKDWRRVVERFKRVCSDLRNHRVLKIKVDQNSSERNNTVRNASWDAIDSPVT